METVKKQRDYLYDNYKAFLIFLVVIGHFIEPAYTNHEFLYTLKWFIFAFHMPAFIFISGYFSKRELTLDKQPVHLTPIEYKIVACLAQNSGKVITYSSLLSSVWGPYADGDNKILRVNMANIRRKIEKDPAQPKYIFTEVGVGYRMAEDEDE